MGERLLITARGHTTSGRITIVGKNDLGTSISEATPHISVLSENTDFTYVTMHSYNATFVKSVSYEGLANVDIIVGHIDSSMDNTYPPRKSTLTEQDKEALKAIIHEVVTEVVNEALDERERRADEAKRREFWEI